MTNEGYCFYYVFDNCAGIFDCSIDDAILSSMAIHNMPKTLKMRKHNKMHKHQHLFEIFGKS